MHVIFCSCAVVIDFFLLFLRLWLTYTAFKPEIKLRKAATTPNFFNDGSFIGLTFIHDRFAIICYMYRSIDGMNMLDCQSIKSKSQSMSFSSQVRSVGG